MASKKLVSIIIPAYNSHQTIKKSLESFLNQDYEELEIIIVDSSPNDLTTEIVNRHFNELQYFHSQERLLPHAARNYGVEKSKGSIIIFTDPDIYAPTDWVTKMVRSWETEQSVIIGGLRCYNREYYKRGVHLVKFDIWLPGGEKRLIDITPTANMLIDRSTFDEVGNFDTSEMLGDTLYSWKLAEFKKPVFFIPDNFVDHDHTCSISEFLTERIKRGSDFGRLRKNAENLSLGRIVFLILISILPARLLKLELRILAKSIQSGNFSDFVFGQPMIIAGWYMWLIGECKAYIMSR